MGKNKLISVSIITLNEEKNLPRCLKSIKSLADEIVLVDSGSTDKTIEIAKSYGAKIYKHKFDTFDRQKNWAVKKATGDWIFAIDADEVATSQLADEIALAVQSDEHDAYLIPRRNIILGEEIKHTRWAPDIHIWLWKKGIGKWTKGVHSEVKVGKKYRVGRLKNAKMHNQFKTINEFIKMLNKYTSYEAQEMIDEGYGFSLFRMVFDPSLSFFRRFIYKKGFLDGWRGFVLSVLMSFYRFTTWVKVWEGEKVTK